MAGTLDAPEPGTAAAVAAAPAAAPATAAAVAAAPAAAPAVSAPGSVQEAIDNAVAAFRANLEGKIKTGLTPSTGIVSRVGGGIVTVAGDVKSGVGSVVSGAEGVGGDFLDVIRGKPAQIQNSAGVEQSIPRWLMYAVFALAIVGAGALTDLALHALKVL